MLVEQRGLTDDGILQTAPQETFMVDRPRLDVLEGRVEEQARNWDRVRGQIAAIDRRFAAVDRRFDDVDRKIDDVDRKIDDVDRKIDDVARDLSSRIVALDEKVDRKIDSLDQKVDRKLDDLRTEIAKQFQWTIGTMITLLCLVLTLGAGVMTALLAPPGR